MNQQTLSAFIWSVADLLRGDYKQSDYGKVILPFTVLRRLDCVLESTKPAVLTELADKEKQGVNPEPFLLRKAGQSFYNTSTLDLKKLLGDPDHIAQNLFSYVQAFSPAVRDVVCITQEFFQVQRGAVVEALAGCAQQELLRVDACFLAGGQLGQHGGFGGLEHAVQAAQHGEGQDDFAVVGLLVVATQQVGHGPDEGGEGLLVH